MSEKNNENFTNQNLTDQVDDFAENEVNSTDQIDLNFDEEIAAEIDAPIMTREEFTSTDQPVNKGLGYSAIVISVLALFFMPLFLGGAGIIVGFIARARGALTLGAWAIGIGSVAVILSLFFTPMTNISLF